MEPDKTIHHSKTSIGGGKNTKVVRSLLREEIEKLELKFSVKGYKSSEGDTTFPPPVKEEERWEDDGGYVEATE